MDEIAGDVLFKALRLVGRYLPALRAVCQRWREVALRLRAETRDTPYLLYELAELGHEGLVAWIKDQRAHAFGRAHANLILAGSALGGHETLMRQALAWGATDVDGALACAAEGGRAGAMLLARSWGARKHSRAMSRAAEAGNERFVKQLRQWGGNDFEAVLLQAAQWGHVRLLWYARAWGARAYGIAKRKAEAYGHYEASRLLSLWIGADSGAWAARHEKQMDLWRAEADQGLTDDFEALDSADAENADDG